MAKQATAQRRMEVTWQPFAECLSKDCTWSTPQTPNARQLAKDHATFRNHKTRIIKETVAVYCRDDYDVNNDRDDL